MAKKDAEMLNAYRKVIETVFIRKYTTSAIRIAFTRDDIDKAIQELGINIRNLGDVVYSFRYRINLPESINALALPQHEWIILGGGKGLYEFRLANAAKVMASSHRKQIKVPDATPEIIRRYKPKEDEQALLTKVRYNRLVDLFTGLTCYSIQNHYRTTIAKFGQIEVDEIYVGLSKNGAHYVLPCQAKSRTDSFGLVQSYQDILMCRAQYQGAIARSIGIQFTTDDSIAILELDVVEENEIFQMTIVEEKHYILVPQSEISRAELEQYEQRDAM